MRIVIINALYTPYKVGGAEVSVQLLAEALANAGNEVSVITLSDKKEYSFESINDVKVCRVPLSNIYWPFSKAKASLLERLIWHALDVYNFGAKGNVYKLLAKIKPDVLHTNNISGFSVSVWDAASELKIPIVHTSRDYYLIHPNSTLYSNGLVQNPKSFKIKALSLIKKWKSNKVSLYLPISDYIKNLHSDLGFFANAKKVTIYNSVDTPPRLPRENTSAGKRKTVLGFIGRVEPSKGLETILEAFDVLGAGYELLIAGTGAEKYVLSLKERKTIQKIHWLGSTSPTNFFSRIDILIVPSLWEEPLGRVILESYSYGVPVIASRSGGIPEIVKVGETGYCYEKNNSGALAVAIKEFELHRDLATQDRCIEYAKKFAKENIQKKYISELAALQKSV